VIVVSKMSTVLTPKSAIRHNLELVRILTNFLPEETIYVITFSDFFSSK